MSFSHPSMPPVGARILFACFPSDGHFNPLTGLAVHLKRVGYDVRFYAASQYHSKLEALGIPQFGFVEANELKEKDVNKLLPLREKATSQLAKFNFDLKHLFIDQAAPYYADLLSIRRQFPFDLLIADLMFTAIPLVHDLMAIPVVSVSIVPITATSKDLPPAGVGATPSTGFFGRRKQDFMRWMATYVLFAKTNRYMHETFARMGVEIKAASLFDANFQKADLVLQTGTPGFEYSRTDLPANLHFVGSLLPASSGKTKSSAADFASKLLPNRKLVLATQGTVESDSSKLLVPCLEAFAGSEEVMLVVVTGNAEQAALLRRQYTQPNVLIEAYIPFAEIMPRVDAYVSNGGMGGVQLAIEHGLPMVVAGVHEGKLEITARVGYFGLGVNLKTETPGLGQLKNAVLEVLHNPVYKANSEKLRAEAKHYDAPRLCEQLVGELLAKQLPKTKRLNPVSAAQKPVAAAV